jgi:serine/threonine-protein kinase
MIGRNVLHYLLLEKIGAGAMGEVHKAQDSHLNRFVAIKLLPEGKAADPSGRLRFIQEAQAASSLNHPNIITIYDVVSEGGVECIVMEYVGGKTLLELIPNGGLSIPQVLMYGVQIAGALSAAHAANIVHRDLKPGNVMITSSGLVKVLDFGLAKIVDKGGSTVQFEDTVALARPALTVEGSILGTLSYMSPEQAEGKKVDTRSDIFSFGAVLYEMITGHRAFDGGSPFGTITAILRDEVAPIAGLVPNVPPQLEQIVSRCLRKDPAERCQSMQQVEMELTALKQQSDSGGLYTPVIPPARRSFSKPWAIGAAGVLLAVACAGGLWWFAHRGAAPQMAPPVAVAPVAVAPATPVPTATQVPPSAPADSALTNDSIVEMTQAKAPVSVIISHIRSSTTKFDLSTAEVIRLVKAGVAEKVIDAMRDPKRAVRSAANPTTAVSPPPPPIALPEKTPPPTAPPETTASAPVAPPPAAKLSTQVTIGDGFPFRIALDEDIPGDAEAGRPLRFSVAEDLRVGAAIVIAKGAAVTGEIAEAAGKKKFLGKGSKISFRLLKADGVGGQKLSVRATPGRGAGGISRRAVDTGKDARSKELAAARGAQYIGYMDGEQTVSVLQ